MRYLVAAAVAVGALVVAGCTASPGNQGTGGGLSGSGSASGTGSASGSAAVPGRTVRLGFVADITQGTAMVGIREGLFAASLGRGVALRPISFASDSAEAQALAAGKLDAAYVSPDAMLTVLASRHASPIVVVSGASAADAELVVNRRLEGPAALRGHSLAVPAASGAQDVALRAWLAARHLSVGARDGVTVTAISPGPAVIDAFRTGKIAGAVELPPWDIELAAAGGRVLPGSAGLSGSAAAATANLVVTRKFLDADSAAVYALLRGQVQANDFLRHNLLEASEAIGAGLAAAGHPISSSLLALSMAQVNYTDDPLAHSLTAQANETSAAGLAAPLTIPPLLYDFAPLDLVLRAAGEPPVTS